MKVTFMGAARTVTGSCYIMECGSTRFALDCGMHQGNKEIETSAADADTDQGRAGDGRDIANHRAHLRDDALQALG